MISWGELHCALAKKKGGGASFQSFMKIVFKAKQEMTAKGGNHLGEKKREHLRQVALLPILCFLPDKCKSHIFLYTAPKNLVFVLG